jgi:hypothetical protein
MALSSPGVEVKVIDESFYTPAAAGSVPLIIVASAENKLNGAGDGIAPGTLKANAGRVYLITSQKDLVDTFGDPVFKTDVNNNPIHAGEQNEYGLQAAYSTLGVSNRAFVVRAEIDLAQLDGKAAEPKSVPENGTYWLDTQVSKLGIFEWNNAPVTTQGGQTFVSKTPIIVSDNTKINPDTGGPLASVGKNGSYALVTTIDTVTPDLTDKHPMTVWYRNSTGVWVQVGSEEWEDSFPTVPGVNPPTPRFRAAPHTQVPAWKNTNAATTGSVWIKTTEPNSGARWRVKRYSTVTGAFEETTALLFKDNAEALFNLDKARGGVNITVGQVYVKYSDSLGEFKLFRKRATAPTTIRTDKITASTFQDDSDAPVTYTFKIAESKIGQPTLGNDVTVSFEIAATSLASDVEIVAAAINSAGLANVEASVDSQNRLVIIHELGGEIHFDDGTNSPLSKLGFDAFNAATGSGMLNLYDDEDGAHDYVASLWEPLVYVAGADAPTTLTSDGTLWYSSVIDEVDMMVHNGTTWVGYGVRYPQTDELGPFVTATAPTSQRDGTDLADNDLWISTADIENFPTIYRWSLALSKWLLVDKSDQTTDEGVLFADARWGLSGNADEPGSISDLRLNSFIDVDAPDPALYPSGMLLWNLRRSGFNVKQFRKNYIDLNSDNVRFNDEQMTGYYPHRWVTISANQDDGSGNFGRKAQRKVIIQSLQALVNTNQSIRDDESRIFNLLACPGYPELIGEMITLNFDRGLTSFIVGDTPARLTPDATSILEWGTNQRLAVEDNDQGLVSSDEYLGIFYPWGFTSDNFGNNVVIPPSHMMLRTIILNDQVAYPWFAPAGLRRGGITNASSVGYVDSLEGEFKPVALNVGQRDTLYDVKVNPITFITGSGLVNYGQKTRSRGSSALDRINVSRLVIHLRRQLNLLAKPYIFEPNDKITRDEIKAAVESLLVELVGQRALYDFLVVCDESNNFPSRIDRNELWIDIAIEPVKAIEFIYIPLRLKNTGEISGL